MDQYREFVLRGDIAGLQQEKELLSPEERMEECMFLGLRMTDGICIEDYQSRFGEPVEKRFGEVIEKHLRQGLLRSKTVEAGGITQHRLALTEYGLDVANYVMADYIL